jgi:hypothetical protein
MGNPVYAIDEFPDDDLPWRIEWIGGLGYNTSVPGEPRIDVCLAQLHAVMVPAVLVLFVFLKSLGFTTAR